MNISVLAAAAATVVFALTMVYAGFTDFRSRTIRNGVIVLLLLAYAVLAPIAGFASYEIGWSVAVSLGVLIVGAVFFALGWLGGGDAKLAAVTALWLGTDHTGAYFIYTALLGAVFAASIVIFRAFPLPDRAQNIRLGRSIARAGCRHALWRAHGAGRAFRLPGNALDDDLYLRPR